MEKVHLLRGCGTIIDGNDQLELKLAPGYPLSRFFSLLEQNGITPGSVELRRPTLEAVFLHLTGRRLRD
jgi:ABC-2 type transport system ATP-binding protein